MRAVCIYPSRDHRCGKIREDAGGSGFRKKIFDTRHNKILDVRRQFAIEAATLLLIEVDILQGQCGMNGPRPPAARLLGQHVHALRKRGGFILTGFEASFF